MLRNVKCRFLQDPPTHLDGSIGSPACTCQDTADEYCSSFLLFHVPFFGRVRTLELTRCRFPDLLLMCRDLRRSPKYVFHNPVERPSTHTAPLYRLLTSALHNVYSSRCYRTANRFIADSKIGFDGISQRTE